MNFSRVIKFTLYLCLVSFLMAGCVRSKDKTFKIGVSQCSGGDWREKMNEEMRRELLFHDDAVIEIRNADDDNEKQIADIRYFMDNDFDIIVTAPNEAEAITPVLKEAYDKGIPIVIFDRKINGDSYTSYIELDNIGIGKTAAQYASSISGGKRSNIVEITGLPGSTPAQERHASFSEEVANRPELNLITSVPGDWNEESGYRLADSLLDLYPEIDIIYAHNDPMAVGVSKLLKEKGRRDIKVLGTDASPLSGMPAVKEGTIDATFIYPTEGERIINTAMAILHGETFERTVHVPSLAAIDSSNAPILIRQYELIKAETEKIERLNELNEDLWSRHKAQTAFLWTVIGFAILLTVLSTLLIILFVRNRKLGKMLSIRDLLANRKRLQSIYYPSLTAKEMAPEKEKKSEEVRNDLDKIKVRESNIKENDNKNEFKEEKKHINNDFYNSFIEIIKSRYNEADLNTDKIAEALSIGGAQLTRKIKAFAGYTPVEILRTYRLEQAKKQLAETSKTVNEITHSVGFASAAYLTKCFRETYGVTPTEFREGESLKTSSH